MKIYVFGNEDLREDNLAFKVVRELGSDFRVKNVEFVTVRLNEDVPFIGEKNVIIMDIVQGLDGIKVFDEKSFDKIILSPRISAHDFDLSFQLKYLKKLGKLGKITIIGLPQGGDINYNSLHSIFKKLVAQDMQGS